MSNQNKTKQEKIRNDSLCTLKKRTRKFRLCFLFPSFSCVFLYYVFLLFPHSLVRAVGRGLFVNVQGKAVSGTTGLRHWAVSSIAYLAAGLFENGRCCSMWIQDDDGVDGRYALAIFKSESGPSPSPSNYFCLPTTWARRLIQWIYCIADICTWSLLMLRHWYLRGLHFLGSWMSRHVGYFPRGGIKSPAPSSARCLFRTARPTPSPSKALHLISYRRPWVRRQTPRSLWHSRRPVVRWCRKMESRWWPAIWPKKPMPLPVNANTALSIFLKLHV